MSNIKTFTFMLVESIVLSLILVVIIKIHSVQEVFLVIIFPENPIIIFPYNLIGLFMGFFGFTLTIWTNYTLLQKISLDKREPFHTPSALVLNGPFQFTSNPVNLSVIMMTLGLAMFLGSLILFTFPPILFILFHRFLIQWEEKKLEETFGEEYLDNKKNVRRWF